MEYLNIPLAMKELQTLRPRETRRIRFTKKRVKSFVSTLSFSHRILPSTLRRANTLICACETDIDAPTTLVAFSTSAFSTTLFVPHTDTIALRLKWLHSVARSQMYAFSFRWNPLASSFFLVWTQGQNASKQDARLMALHGMLNVAQIIPHCMFRRYLKTILPWQLKYLSEWFYPDILRDTYRCVTRNHTRNNSAITSWPRWTGLASSSSNPSLWLFDLFLKAEFLRCEPSQFPPFQLSSTT